MAGAESDRISPLISRPTSWTKSRSVEKSPLRKVAESDRTQSDCETIGILEDENEDDSKFRNLGLSGRPINFVTALIENRAFVNPILPTDLKFTWVRSHIELHRYRTTSFP